MDPSEEEAFKSLLEEALWQIEEAKKVGLSILKAMNFINLSREARGYGNIRLSSGLLQKAKESLFNDLVEHLLKEGGQTDDMLGKLRLERTVKESRDRFQKGDLKGAYEQILQRASAPKEDAQTKNEEESVSQTPQAYAQALEVLQKAWLRMKQEENKGKDVRKAQSLLKDAKTELASGNYGGVMSLCHEMSGIVLSPQDRLKDEVEETIDDITKTLKALFPGEARSPKERFFKKQIEDLIAIAKENLSRERPVEAINASRKAKDILMRLEQESIKDDIPKMIMELKTSVEDLRTQSVDVSYEGYLLKQVEETFWKGEYIKARKIANKLESIVRNAQAHQRMNQLNSRLGDLSRLLKDRAGTDGYMEARDCLQKAKTLLEQSSFDMAATLLDKAQNALQA